MGWRDHIEQRPEVMVGKPVIRGTRLTVELILERLGQGSTDAQLMEAYPRLLPEHIRAAQAYAAHAIGLKRTRIRPPAVEVSGAVPGR